MSRLTMAEGMISSLSLKKKTNLRKRASFLCCVLFLSLFSQMVNYTPTSTTEWTEEAMSVADSAGHHSSSPIHVVDPTNVTFDVSHSPYHWFSTTGLTDSTYINVSGNSSSVDSYVSGTLTTYTAYDLCTSLGFMVANGASTLCHNPSLESTLLFSIDFINGQDGTSLLQDNLTLTISVEHHINIVTPPPVITPYNFSDGDINADSDTWNRPLIHLDNESTNPLIEGYFENANDRDYLTFTSAYSGTHRLNLTLNRDVNPVIPSGFFDCRVSDTTGFQMVKDIREGWSVSNPSYLTAVGTTLYFRASDGTNGDELWKSDGTASGTMMVKDINSGSSSSSPSELTAVGNTLYFTANDGTNGFELWKSDGTSSGTMLVKDIYEWGDSSLSYLTAVGATLFFYANDGISGAELWKSDGTTPGTVMVKDIYSGSGSGAPYYPTAFGNTLYFTADDGTNGRELWKSDGTASGTAMVKDINSGSSSSSPTSLTAVGNTLYFTAYDGTNNTELWKSDGTESGTMLVKDIYEWGGSSPSHLTAVGSTLYFRATDGTNGYELWKSDGTTNGTVMVKDINGGSGSSSLNYLTAIGTTLYFRAYDGINGHELWKSDGSESGTMLVKDIYEWGDSYPSGLTAVGNNLYFVAGEGTNGYELWKSDGTASGTVMAKDINSGSGSSSPNSLTAIGTTLYFTANDGTNGHELYSLRESNAVLFEKYIDCLIVHTSGFEANTFNFGFDPIGQTESQMPWMVSVSFEQVHPLEDPMRGDSDDYNGNPPLVQANSNVNGQFHMSGDSDRYAISIEHGTIQHINVQTQDATLFSFSSAECYRDGEYENRSMNDVFELDTSWNSNRFSCDTRYYGDEIEFQITQDTSFGTLPLSSPYILKMSTSPLTSLTAQSTEMGVFDVPARGAVPILNLTDQVNGSFLHWSDQTDGYEVILGFEQSVQVDLTSNCGTLNSVYKSSSLQSRVITYGLNNAYAKNILSDGREVYDISVHRLESNDIHEPELKDICTYTLQTASLSPSLTFSSYQISYDGRIHSSTPLQISNFSEYLPPNATAEYYQFELPFDVLPTLDGTLQATQVSGEPVFLQLLGTHYRSSEMNNLSVGQHIDFGNNRVQWNRLAISGLDGSGLTVFFIEQPLLLYSKESLELFSVGTGALGSSRDEGWDDMDTWTINNSASTASFASVRISSLTGDLQAMIGGSTISQLVCFNSDSSSITLNHLQGQGSYTLEAIRGYTACPSVSLDAPSLVAELSSFSVQYTTQNEEALHIEIFDEKLDTVYHSYTTSLTQIVTLPASVNEGTYRLLLMDENNIVYHEQPLQVTHEPYEIVRSTADLLDIDDPQIFIQSFMPHTGEPMDWTFTNISIRTLSEFGVVNEQDLDDEYTGLGAKVVTVNGIPDVMPGSMIQVNGELHIGDGFSTHSMSWKKVYHSPVISCESEINPDNQLPENDILCLISLEAKTHGSSTSFLTEHALDGTLDVYNDRFQIVEQIEFSNELFHATPVRIDSINLGTGEYFVKLNLSSQSSIYLTESVGQFEVGSFVAPEDEQESIGSFDLTLISVRDTASAGDKILFAWDIIGEKASYFFIEVYSNEVIVQSFYVFNDGAQKGKFTIELPEDINPYLTHQVIVHAFSEYGSVSIASASIEGMSQQIYLDVNINPDRPTIGSEIEVQLMLSNNDDWMRWNWVLRSSWAANSEPISAGDGFANKNQGTFTFELPLSQYTTSPYLHLEVESEDGTIFYETIKIDPVPLRSVNLVMDSEMVIEKMYEVQWELDGQYLNTLDNIERIEFSILTMDYEVYHEDVYFVNSAAGDFETLIPSSLKPGSHRVQVEFTFADGDTYEHSQIITVLSSPPGLNAFGLNIPPLAMGFDTVIVTLLLIHAIFLHRRNPTKRKSKEDDETYDETYDEAYDEAYDETYDEALDDKKKSWDDSSREDDDNSSEVQEQNEDILAYPMYQEYPSNSGNHWVKYEEETEWELIEV